jgi:hypothetical protein
MTLPKQMPSWLAVAFAILASCGSDGEKSSSDDDGGGATPPPPGAVADGGGDAGRGPNALACPADPPNANSPCSLRGLECGYGARACSCESPAPADPTSWRCTTTQGNPMQTSCPAAEPMSGSACTDMRGSCRFGARICDCVEDTNTWACWNPGDCPPMVPAEQAACTVVGMSCEYRGAGGGGGDECECEATGWDCGRQFCPPALPTVGSMCEGGDGTCPFGDTVCDCSERAWACWKPSECPASAPVESSACMTEGMVCPYGRGSCECDDKAWDCRGVPRGDAGVPVDAGSNRLDGGLDATM